MKNRWLNLLFALTCVLVASLSYHLFAIAKTTAVASLIINILKPLNILLFMILLFVVSRNLFKLYLERRRQKTGFRLRTKLVLALLPITLAPSIILFVISTRFVDDVLLELVSDTSEARIIANSEQMRLDYLTAIEALYTRHASAIMEVFRESAPKDLVAYLDAYGLQGVEIYQNGALVQRALATGFPSGRIFRLDQSASPDQPAEPLMFDDGFLVARFIVPTGANALHFIYTADTPFTERFRYVRDSFSYLKHTQKKTEKLKGLNQGILLVVTLSVIFGGIWIGLAFARSFLGGFALLIDGAQKVSQGQFDTRVDLKTGDEMEGVALAFNSMTATLKENQTELKQKARDLQTVNAELSDQIQYGQTILRQVNAGILSVDMDGRVRTFNPALARILELDLSLDAPLAEALDVTRHCALQDQWRVFKAKGYKGLSQQIELLGPDGQSIYAACTMVPLVKEDEPFGSLIVLEDLTKLLNAQKLAAWQEVAKRVAHEIKNPLTPIQLSIQRVRRKIEKSAPDLDQAVISAYETIMSETDLLKNLVDEFSTFAKLPSPNKATVDLKALARAVCEAYQPMYRDLRIEADLPQDPCPASCDASQMRQVLSNLVSNAARASEPGGRVTVGVRRRGDAVELSVADEGRGVPESEREKVFMPYYSKSPKGTGLGLAIVKRIVEDHDGSVRVGDQNGKGAVFTVSFPA